MTTGVQIRFQDKGWKQLIPIEYIKLKVRSTGLTIYGMWHTGHEGPGSCLAMSRMRELALIRKLNGEVWVNPKGRQQLRVLVGAKAANISTC